MQGSEGRGLASLPAVPALELEAAGDDLATGDESTAAIRLALLLRLAPSTAPAVAALLEDAGSPILSVVRGDALRLIGRAAEAERAWAQASAELSHRTAAGPARPAPSAPAMTPAHPAPSAPAMTTDPPESGVTRRVDDPDPSLEEPS